jgi:hypothetical protein
MNLKSNIMIFSVFQLGQSDAVNLSNHTQVVGTLKAKGIPLSQLNGKYNGQKEHSILVEGFEHRDTVERVCGIFNQECYLESHCDRESFLVYPTGAKVAVGKLQGVPKAIATAMNSYTYEPTLDQYYVTK